MQPSQIVAALRANVADAPAELFDVYGEQLIAYCWQSLRNADATLIAVRDTMIVAQAHAERLRDPELLGPWLLALAEAECARRKPAAAGAPGQGGKAGDAGDAGEAPGTTPSAAGMREEILACFADPGQARYRAVAADRVPSLGADGFPARSGVSSGKARWARRPDGRLKGGLITTGIAAAAASALAASGVWLLAGAKTAPSAPAAPIAGVASSPPRDNSAAPQVPPAAGMRQPVLVAGPGRSAARPNQQGLFDVGSESGPTARPSRGGSLPPASPVFSASPTEQQPSPSGQPTASPSSTGTQPEPTSSPWPTPSSMPSSASPSSASPSSASPSSASPSPASPSPASPSPSTPTAS